MFERILVPLDGSPLAQAVLPYVAVVARAFHGRVILFHVVESGLDHEAPEQKSYADETMERIRPLAQTYLARLAEEIRKDGIDVETRVVKGRAAAQIVEQADREKVGLIAMSTHGRSGLARWVMGSGIDRILRACEQPVLLVRPRAEGDGEADGQLSKIVVPLDGSEAAEAALPFGEELAKVLGLEIILIRAMGVETTVQFGPAVVNTCPVSTRVLERLDVVASGYLAGLATTLKNKGLKVQWELLRGSPGPRIVEFAKETSNSMVVMTTHGRSGLRRWILGSVADQVVRHAGEPVLVIRPVNR